MLKDIFQLVLSFIGVVCLSILAICSVLFIVFVTEQFGDWLGLWEV